MRKTILYLIWIACFTVSTSGAIPSLDEMAGEWLQMDQVGNPPAVHNFNHMLVVNRDLTSFFCNPGELYITQDRMTTQWRAGYPLVTLSIDGVSYPAVETRAYAYRALRRNSQCDGLVVETDTRMVNEERGVLSRITVSNPTDHPRTLELVLHVPGEPDDDGQGAINATQREGFVSAIRPSSRPDSVRSADHKVEWLWRVHLAPGGATAIGFVSGDDTAANATQTRRNVSTWAEHFEQQMDAFVATWKQRWTDAFTPGNTHFSGSLPVLETSNEALRRGYYMGVVTMLELERTQFPVNRAFVTSGERRDGLQYFWDAAMQANVWALLEPQGMKAVLRRWLVQNARGYPAIQLQKTSGFDAKHYDTIVGYAFNACAIFNAADTFLRITGDRPFLDETLEDGRTVIQVLDALATDWETLPKNPQGLVDYGSNGRLLETAPTYIECVASVNAQNISMMRKMSEWQTAHGDTERSQALIKKAKDFLPVVLSLYNEKLGSWDAARREGGRTEVRHCVDYIYVGEALNGDLSPAQRRGMNQFAQRELLTDHWMRAMSLSDLSAPRSFRPDHSPTGAYDGWIPLTAKTLWRLGEPKAAFDFYCRAAAVTREGPFAQAHEFYGPHPTEHDAPVRIALRGSNMKECISGVAFTDVVITTFFGFDPAVDGGKILKDESLGRPFTGELLQVHTAGKLRTIKAGSGGLTLSR